MDDDSDLKPATLLAHGGRRPDPVGGDVAPPIRPSTNYARDEAYRLLDGATSYSRDANPGYPPVENLLARLEGGADAILLSSGMAAVAAVLQALRPGDHVILQRIIYWGARDWIIAFCRDWGLSLDLVDGPDLAALGAAVKPKQTKLVWIETPANPTWDVVDIAGAADLAHAAGARLVVDSTVATPIHTRPIEHGADIVMHSATKALNGHGDAVAGALIAARNDEFWERVRANRAFCGAVLGPFETWLLHRGLRTLHLRVASASANALTLARHFERHPKLDAVLYPGLESHPGHEVAKRQMADGFGYGLGIRVKGGGPAALALACRCKLIVRATSLGGTETLIEHRASVEGPNSPVPANLLRISVGIEDAGDLIADLEQALAGLS
jgi:cystathionine gamma-synthase